MKKAGIKTLAIFSLFSLLACNSDSEESYYTEGSLERVGTTVMIVSDTGVEYLPQNGNYPSFTSRRKIQFEYQYASDVREDGEGSKVPIHINHVYYEYQTATPVKTSEFTESDPLLGVTVNRGLPVYNNYINIEYENWMYTQNKPTGEDFSTYSLTLQVDPEIVEAETGNDTIAVNLVFKINRAEDEIPVGRSLDIISIDISSFATNYDFPATTPSGSDKEYIIKVNYRLYNTDSSYDDEKTHERFSTTKWIPNKPFKGE